MSTECLDVNVMRLLLSKCQRMRGIKQQDRSVTVDLHLIWYGLSGWTDCQFVSFPFPLPEVSREVLFLSVRAAPSPPPPPFPDFISTFKMQCTSFFLFYFVLVCLICFQWKVSYKNLNEAAKRKVHGRNKPSNGYNKGSVLILYMYSISRCF